MKLLTRCMPYIEPTLDIWLACRKGLLTEVQRFVSEGVDVNARAQGEIAPLHEAAENGQVAIVEWLIARGADPNAKTASHRGDPGSYTPLHLAVRRSHLQVVELLIRHGAKANARMSDGYTPLIIAAENGCLNLVKVLANHGADLAQRGPLGIDAFTVALLGDHLEIAMFLRDRGVPIDQGSGAFESTPLMQAAGNKMLKAVLFLLQSGADVRARDLRDETALHCAVIGGAVPVTKWTSDTKAAVSHEIGPNDGIEIIGHLLKAGADPNARDRDGMTPLAWAKKLRHEEIMRLFNGQGNAK